MKTLSRLLVWTALFVCGVPVAQADPGLTLSNATYARTFPSGLSTVAMASYEGRLSKRKGILFERTFWKLRGHAAVSPTMGIAGVGIEVQPLAILNVAANYRAVGFFGTFGQIQSYPTAAQADISDQGLLDGAANGYASRASMWTIETTLQGAVGPIVARSKLFAARWDVALNDGDEWFYDVYYDALVRDRGWVLQNNLDVMAQLDRLYVGARHTYVRSVGRPGGGDAQAATHRVGPVMAYTWSGAPTRSLRDITAFLAAQWWVDHEDRAGSPIPSVTCGVLIDAPVSAVRRARAEARSAAASSPGMPSVD